MKSIKLIAIMLIVVGVCFSTNMQNINGYFSDEESVSDELVFGNVETEIVEEYDTKPIIPGEEFKKVVRIKNIGKNSCFVRVKILISPEEYAEELNLNINTNDWEYKNGFYYYKKPLNSGEITTPLFTKLTIPSGLNSGDVFDINIYSESIQSVIYGNNHEIIDNYSEIFEKIS